MKLTGPKRIVVTVTGFIVIIIGIVFIVFPRLAFIVIPIGPTILATEYERAKKVFDKIKRGVQNTFNR